MVFLLTHTTDNQAFPRPTHDGIVSAKQTTSARWNEWGNCPDVGKAMKTTYSSRSLLRGTRYLFLCSVIVCLAATILSADQLRVVSVADATLTPSPGGNGDSLAPIINSNGTHVVFASSADNLLTGTNGSISRTSPQKINVYLRNRTNATTVLVSESTAGSTGDGDSFPDDFSADGSLVLFESTASNLVANDANGVADIFIRNITNQTTTRVTVSTSNGDANGASRSACMSADGRYVAFVSSASNLVLGDTNTIADVFVRDLLLENTVLASVDATSASISSLSASPDISDDGRYVAFYSSATNLVPGVGLPHQIYVRDLVSGITIDASADASSTLTTVRGTATTAACYNHILSRDGRYVVYEASSATGSRNPGIILRYDVLNNTTEIVHTNAFVPFNTSYQNIRTLDITPDGRYVAFIANTNGSSGTTRCVNVWDGNTGTIALANGDTNGAVIAGTTCEWPSIDASGRYVAFAHSGAALAPNAGASALYIRDLQLGATTLIRLASTNPAALNTPITPPTINASGNTVLAACVDQNSVAGTKDIFSLDVQTAATEFISAHGPGPSSAANASSFLSAWGVSDNGRYVAFSSFANNLVKNDTNANRDIFVRDLVARTNALVSVGLSGAQASGVSTEPAISGDGRFVAFTSTATNLATLDKTSKCDVFVADRQTGTMTLGSVNSTGTGPGNGYSYAPRISNDGKILLFKSTATTLFTTTYTGSENLFVRNLSNSTTVALTTASVLASDMTPDGRYVAFATTTNLAAPNTYVVYVWDTQLARRIYTNVTVTTKSLAISPDGSRVAFSTTNFIYLASRQTNSSWITSSIAQNTKTNTPTLKFSADSRTLVFTTASQQSGISDSNGAFDVLLYDLSTLTTTVVSRDYHPLSNATANGPSDYATIGANGQYVLFRSTATNLVPGISNSLSRLYLHDRARSTNTVLTGPGSSRSLFSADGRTILLSSSSADISQTDLPDTLDLFQYVFLYASVTSAQNPGEAPKISWPAMPGRTYQVQYKDNIDDASWQDLNDPITVADDTA